MIALKQLKSELSSKKSNITSSDFFNLHRFLEAYIKRVLLISLRINGVKYEESTNIVEKTYVNTAALIDKVFFLLDQTGRKQQDVISDLKNTYKDFFVLCELVIKFSAKYRNKLAHGSINELRNPELLNILHHVNTSFFIEFENILKQEYGHSAFEEPRAWGAKRGVNEDISKSAKRLELGKILDEPLTLTMVKNKLATTTYSTP